jgi:uncharacterized integral membrane protein (TIGR00698 family)
VALTDVVQERVQRARTLFPGLLVCLTIAAAARFLSDHYGAPQMLFALLLGLAFHFLAEDGRCKAGIDFSAKVLLRVGVALLGFRITTDAVLSLGAGRVAIIAAGVLATIAVGVLLARLAGRDAPFGVLTGGSVGICGASAALAIASVLPQGPQRERDTVFAVIAVTTLSTIAMIAYPILVTALGLEGRDAGVFLGGTIHDVAQVVGAGYSVSTEVGDVSTITKLFRVAMLVPVVLGLSLLLMRGRAEGEGRLLSRAPLPLFVVAFCVFVAINSAGWAPPMLAEPAIAASRWFLVAAIVALGIKTSLKQLAEVGPIPIAVMLAETAFIALWVLIGVWMLAP